MSNPAASAPEEMEASTMADIPAPKSMVYCGVCTFPPEYCEFSASSSKCRAWLEAHHPSLFEQIWSAEALSENVRTLTAKQAEDLERDAIKKERRAEARAERDAREKESSKIVLTKHARTKRKATTSIVGLHLFNPPLPALKVIAKGLSSRLATGASVAKSASNPQVDEIVIQGDVADDVRDMIVERQKPFSELPPEDKGGVREANILVQEEKKKGAPAA